MTLLHTPRHAYGAILIADPGSAETAPFVQTADTLQCCHCAAHWIVEVGSGKTRGWCWKCQGPVCGRRACVTRCAPWEQQMEAIEAHAKLDRSLEMIRGL